jgi:hypothetical protein
METMRNAENIKKSLAIFLEMENVNFTTVEDNERRILLHINYNFNQGTVGYYIDYQIKNDLIQFMCYTNQHIPEAKRTEVQTYYSLVNDNNTYWGTIHLNVETGATFSRSSLLLDGIQDLSTNLIGRYFSINVYNIGNYFEGAMKIGYGNKSAKEVYHEVISEVDIRLN